MTLIFPSVSVEEEDVQPEGVPGGPAAGEGVPEDVQGRDRQLQQDPSQGVQECRRVGSEPSCRSFCRGPGKQMAAVGCTISYGQDPEPQTLSSGEGKSICGASQSEVCYIDTFLGNWSFCLRCWKMTRVLEPVYCSGLETQGSKRTRATRPASDSDIHVCWSSAVMFAAVRNITAPSMEIKSVQTSCSSALVLVL